MIPPRLSLSRMAGVAPRDVVLVSHDPARHELVLR
jgi:hypothetical protein